MHDKKNNTSGNGDQQKENANIDEAHKQADKDIDNDPDLNSDPEPEDDLDEGELANFEGEE